MAVEAAKNKTSSPEAPAVFGVCEKLRPHLSTLMGNTGYRALLARALARAEEEVPSLRALQVNEDGTLQRPVASAVQVDLENSAEGSIVFLAQLLALLMAFIGENLTLRLLREIWPKALLNNLSFEAGDGE